MFSISSVASSAPICSLNSFPKHWELKIQDEERNTLAECPDLSTCVDQLREFINAGDCYNSLKPGPTYCDTGIVGTGERLIRGNAIIADWLTGQQVDDLKQILQNRGLCR